MRRSSPDNFLIGSLVDFHNSIPKNTNSIPKKKPTAHSRPLSTSNSDDYSDTTSTTDYSSTDSSYSSTCSSSVEETSPPKLSSLNYPKMHDCFFFPNCNSSNNDSFDSHHFLSSKNLQIAVWNTQALLSTSKEDKLRSKIKYACSLLDQNQVVCLQETHGSLEVLLFWFKLYIPHFYMHTSFDCNQTAGLVTFIRKDFAPHGYVLPPTVFQEGRAMRSEIVNGDFL